MPPIPLLNTAVSGGMLIISSLKQGNANNLMSFIHNHWFDEVSVRGLSANAANSGYMTSAASTAFTTALIASSISTGLTLLEETRGVHIPNLVLDVFTGAGSTATIAGLVVSMIVSIQMGNLQIKLSQQLKEV